jgi:two-component system OmpR family response regulator
MPDERSPRFGKCRLEQYFGDGILCIILFRTGGPPVPRILVVEDDDEVREVVCEFLRESGHLVLSAGSAQQARRLLAAETIDLMLIDCVMSGEQGGSLAEHASALGVAAILTSGDVRYSETAAQPGIPFLTKPFRLSELDDLISRTLAPPPR